VEFVALVASRSEVTWEEEGYLAQWAESNATFPLAYGDGSVIANSPSTEVLRGLLAWAKEIGAHVVGEDGKVIDQQVMQSWESP